MELSRHQTARPVRKQSGQMRSLPDYISIIGSGSCAKIRIDDIEIIEQDGRKLHVITASKDYTFYGGLNAIADSLAERAFFRPMKSMIINLDHVKDITGAYINFNSGQCITMGRNAVNMTKRAYKRYLMKYPPYSLWDPVRLSEEYVAETADLDYDTDQADEKENDAYSGKTKKGGDLYGQKEEKRRH